MHRERDTELTSDIRAPETQNRRWSVVITFFGTWTIVIGGYILLGIGIFISEEKLIWVGLAVWGIGICLCCSRRYKNQFQNGQVLSNSSGQTNASTSSSHVESNATIPTVSSNIGFYPTAFPPPYEFVAGKLPTYDEALSENINDPVSYANSYNHPGLQTAIIGSSVSFNAPPSYLSNAMLSAQFDNSVDFRAAIQRSLQMEHMRDSLPSRTAHHNNNTENMNCSQDIAANRSTNIEIECNDTTSASRNQNSAESRTTSLSPNSEMAPHLPSISDSNVDGTGYVNYGYDESEPADNENDETPPCGGGRCVNVSEIELDTNHNTRCSV